MKKVKITRWIVVAILVLVLGIIGVFLAAPPVSPERPSSQYMDPEAAIQDRVEDLLVRMTLAEKIGQMTQVEKNSITPDPRR